jgi:tRNA pseudouridine38-40 synthase
MVSQLCGNVAVTVIGAGRTDTGVHAAGQVAHVDIAARYDDAQLLHALSRMAPDDLAVRALVTVPSRFHARYDAISREYCYTIIERADPFRSRYAWRLDHSLPDDRLAEAAARLLGSHDFTALSKNNPDTPNPVCVIDRSLWQRHPDRLEYRVRANRFLYGMVRLLVGIQIDIARGRRAPEEIDILIRSAERRGRSQAAPARGLSLVEVRYPEPIFQT